MNISNGVCEKEKDGGEKPKTYLAAFQRAISDET